MSNYTVKSGQNLWKIVKEQFGLTNNTQIANKVNQIAKANNMANANSIFTGKTIDLGSTPTDTVERTKTTPVEKLETPVTGVTVDPIQTKTMPKLQTQNTTPSTTPITEDKTTALDNWSYDCADSIIKVDKKTKQPIYGHDVADFNMAGPEFRAAIDKKDYTKAGEIYKQKALETAKSEIKAFDKDGDGAITEKEQTIGEITDYVKRYGKMSKKQMDKAIITSSRKFLIKDLNKDGKVDEKEEAAYLYAMDSNNDKKVANGLISRDELAKTTSYAESKMTNEGSAKFRGIMRACYKSFFGVDTAE